MKQKFQLKNLLKTKPARLTIAEMMIDPAFTVLTDEQKAGKKAGFTNEQFNRNDFGLVNNSGFNPTNNHLGRGGSHNFTSSFPHASSMDTEVKPEVRTSGGEPTYLGRHLPEVRITATPIHGPSNHYGPFDANYFNPSNIKRRLRNIREAKEAAAKLKKEQNAEMRRIASQFSGNGTTLEQETWYVEARMKYSPEFYRNNRPKYAPHTPSTNVTTPVTEEMLAKWAAEITPASPSLSEQLVKDPSKSTDKFSVNTTPLPNGSNLGSSITGPGTDPLRSAVSKVQVANPSFTYNGSTGLYDAMVNMISSVDLTLSGTQAAAKVMEVNLPKFMGVAGKVAPLGGLIDNGVQISQGFNWNDAAQLAVGGVLVGFSATLGAPVVFVGGLGLFVWELGETYLEQNKN
ncbi:MAG: hypothetical protein U0X71_01350 [Sphingobacteriaceae bacterium]